VLNAIASGRYSASWYVGKIETLAASVIVLGVLLSEINLLYRRLGGLATIDGLTGLSNRQAFDNDARFALALRQRHVARLAFLVVDIDFFKQYNDTYGHQAGDACLQRVTAAIRQTCTRSIDLVGRFGGEEFVVLLLDTSQAGAMLMAEAIRCNVESLAIAHAGSSVAKVVTVSIGVMQTAHDRDVELDTLFRRADAALYRAKGQRNAVVMDVPGDAVEEPTVDENEDEEDAVA
jgi:diguanylate cyclase (GGDEF)-like protein